MEEVQQEMEAVEDQPTKATEEPRMEFKNGKLYEYVPQEVGDEEALEQARRDAQATFDRAKEAHEQAKTVHTNAEAAATVAFQELENAQKVKEDAESAFLKSNARCTAAARAKANPVDDGESEPAEPVEAGTDDGSEPDGSGVEPESVTIPIHDADGNPIELEDPAAEVPAE